MEHIEKITAAYEAATGQWDGLTWDTEFEGVLHALESGRRVCLDDIPAAGWGLRDDGTLTYQAHRRAVATAKTMLEDLIDDDCSDDDRKRVIAAWRALVDEEAGAVAKDAARAEESAAAAVEAAQAGDLARAEELAEQAAHLERQYGDDPTWGPFLAAVRAAREE